MVYFNILLSWQYFGKNLPLPQLLPTRFCEGMRMGGGGGVVRNNSSYNEIFCYTIPIINWNCFFFRTLSPFCAEQNM